MHAIFQLLVSQRVVKDPAIFAEKMEVVVRWVEVLLDL